MGLDTAGGESDEAPALLSAALQAAALTLLGGKGVPLHVPAPITSTGRERGVPGPRAQHGAALQGAPAQPDPGVGSSWPGLEPLGAGGASDRR